jgi:hypothetical protein
MYKKLLLILVSFTVLTLTSVSAQTTIIKPAKNILTKKIKTKDEVSKTLPISKSSKIQADKEKSKITKPIVLQRKGFSLQPYLGLSACIPSGKADCTNHWPGGLIGLNSEYRRYYVGFSLNMDYGFLSVMDDGDNVISHNMMHLGFILKGYYPLRDWLDLMAGVGLGYGFFEIVEDKSKSKVSWESLWSDFRWMVGTNIAWFNHVSMDFTLWFTHHFKGKQCSLYQNAGPCTPMEDLPNEAQDIMIHMYMTAGLRYTF